MPAPASEMTRRRHDLVWPDPAAWAALAAERAELAEPPWLAGWAERGWPLMVRRPTPGGPAGRVALGLSLPSSAGRRRIGLDLAPEALSNPQPPPLLSGAAWSAPAAWGATIAQLLVLDAEVRVLGGLAWQALTGLDYLGPGAELDLLWPLPPAAAVEALLAEIAAAEAKAPMRLDGEIVRQDGAAADWRELASGCGEVLVKRLDGVTRESRLRFLAGCA